MALVAIRPSNSMESDVQTKINKNGLIVSRIPSWAKEEIYEEAKWHSDDYGEAIAQFIRDALEYRAFKQKFFNGELGLALTQPEEEVVVENTSKDIKMANGKIIKREEQK